MSILIACTLTLSNTAFPAGLQICNRQLAPYFISELLNQNKNILDSLAREVPFPEGRTFRDRAREFQEEWVTMHSQLLARKAVASARKLGGMVSLEEAEAEIIRQIRTWAKTRGMDTDRRDKIISAIKNEFARARKAPGVLTGSVPTLSIPPEYIGKPMTSGDRTKDRNMEAYNEVAELPFVVINSVRESIKAGYLMVSPEQEQALSDFETEFRSKAGISLLPEDYPDAEWWNSRMRRFRHWHDNIPLIFAHMFIHQRIMAIIGYWQKKQDFFAGKKVPAVEMAVRNFSSRVRELEKISEGHPPEENFVLKELIMNSMTGNRSDLHKPIEGQKELLVNDTDRVVAMLEKRANRIDFCPDNTGEEFLGDLWLTWFLLKEGYCKKTIMHVKHHPLFTSDVTAPEVDDMIERLCSSQDGKVRQIGADLRRFRDSGQLEVRPQPWLISGKSRLEIPEDTRRDLAQSDLVIVKGEYLYRAFIGQYYYSYNDNIDDIMRALGLPPTLFLRIIKTEIAPGVGSERVKRLEAEDPMWFKSGYGMIQLTQDHGSDYIPQTVIDDVRYWNRQITVHRLLPSDGVKDLGDIAVVMKQGLTEMAGGEKGTVQRETLEQRYRVMKQELGQTFDRNNIVEVATDEELVEEANRFRKQGMKVIVLDYERLQEKSDYSAIDGKAGTDYCVISTNMREETDEATVPFLNLNAAALMGVGILNNDILLFEMAYRTFTGEPAPEDMITGLKNETLWIISVLPRMVRFPAEDIEKEAQLQKLFKAAA